MFAAAMHEKHMHVNMQVLEGKVNEEQTHHLFLILLIAKIIHGDVMATGFIK